MKETLVERLSVKKVGKDFFKNLSFGLSAFLLLELALGAANGKARKKVKERSNGNCESCGMSLNKIKVKSVIGHINHDKKGSYHSVDNLKHHCPFCECRHHLNYVGKSKDIGLREQDNRSASHGLLVALARGVPRREFIWFYEENQVQIEILFQRMRRMPKPFLEKFTSWYDQHPF